MLKRQTRIYYVEYLWNVTFGWFRDFKLPIVCYLRTNNNCHSIRIPYRRRSLASTRMKASRKHRDSMWSNCKWENRSGFGGGRTFEAAVMNGQDDTESATLKGLVSHTHVERTFTHSKWGWSVSFSILITSSAADDYSFEVCNLLQILMTEWGSGLSLDLDAAVRYLSNGIPKGIARVTNRTIRRCSCT